MEFIRADCLKQEAIAVDTARKSVTLNNGTKLQYTSLVIATGGDVSTILADLGLANPRAASHL